MNDQRSLTDQLNELYRLAVDNGLYDAADFITTRKPGTAKAAAENDTSYSQADQHSSREREAHQKAAPYDTGEDNT